MSQSEKEQQLLDAAADVFRSPDYDLFSDVEYKAIAERSGWNYKTVQSFFDKPELRRKLIEHMTELDAANDVDAGGIAEALKDESISTMEACSAIGEVYMHLNRVDPVLRSAMALWPYAKHCERDGGSELIRDRLLGLYAAYNDQVTIGLNEWLVSNGWIARLRRGYLTVPEAAQILVSVTEGLSMRHNLDPDHTPAELAGKAYAAILAAMLCFADEEDQPIPPALIEFDRRRSES